MSKKATTPKTKKAKASTKKAKPKAKKAKDLDMEGAAKAVKEGPEAMAKFAGKDNEKRAEEAAKRLRETGGFGKAREVPQGELVKGIQDVAISTRIAISHAAKALDHAEVTLKESEAANQMRKASREAKRRAKEVKKAQAKLDKAVEMMKKVRTDLDTTLRGSGK